MKTKNTDYSESVLKESHERDKVIRIRKHSMIIDGSKKTLVMVRDFSDVVYSEKIRQK